MYQKHAESILALSSQIRNKQKTLRVGSKLWSKRSEIVIFDNCQLRVVMHFPRRWPFRNSSEIESPRCILSGGWGCRAGARDAVNVAAGRMPAGLSQRMSWWKSGTRAHLADTLHQGKHFPLNVSTAPFLSSMLSLLLISWGRHFVISHFCEHIRESGLLRHENILPQSRLTLLQSGP